MVGVRLWLRRSQFGQLYPQFGQLHRFCRLRRRRMYSSSGRGEFLISGL